MGEKLGASGQRFGKVSGTIAVICSLVLFAKHDPISASIGALALFFIWIGLMRVARFLSGSEDLDVSEMSKELEVEELIKACRDSFKEPVEANPDRIMGAGNRALVEYAREVAEEKKRPQPKEPDPEIEENKAWAEMMRVL